MENEAVTSFTTEHFSLMEDLLLPIEAEVWQGQVIRTTGRKAVRLQAHQEPSSIFCRVLQGPLISGSSFLNIPEGFR